MSKQGWITIICLAVAVALLLGSIADAQELERVTFTEVVRSVFYAPQYVALELGFFADEGLDVRMETAWGADKGAAALILDQSILDFSDQKQQFISTSRDRRRQSLVLLS